MNRKCVFCLNSRHPDIFGSVFITKVKINDVVVRITSDFEVKIN